MIFRTENNENIATGWQGDGAPIDWWYDAVAYGFDADPNNPNNLIMTSHWVGPDTLIASCTDLSAKLSVDGGRSWQDGAQFGLPFNTVYHIVPGADGRLYAAVSEVHDMYYEALDETLENEPGIGGIYYSDDNGASWQSLVDFSAPVVWLAVDPNRENTLFASVVDNDLGGIFVTHNLNLGPIATFQRLPSPARTNQRPFNIHILNDGTLVTTWSVRMNTDDGTYTATSGVFSSSDDGQTWQDHSHSNMHHHTMDLVVNPHDPTQNTWLVGSTWWKSGPAPAVRRALLWGK